MLYSKLFTKNGTIEIHVVREYEDRDGGDNLMIHVECAEHRERQADWRIPDIYCTHSYSFTEDEQFRMEDYLRNNEAIIWDDWREAEAKADA